VAAPLAAAASVVAVVATVLSLTGPDGTRGQAPSAGREPGQGALNSVPRHYVALTGSTEVSLNGSTVSVSERLHAQVRSTATGATLATVRPPRPYGTFSWVSGAADDQAFVLAAQRWVRGDSASQNANEPARFFRLRVDLVTGAAVLTALPITEKPGYRVFGMALSPDGSKLAVAVAAPGTAQVPRTIQVFSVATGAQHDWTWAGPGLIGTQHSSAKPLSWAADNRTLAFALWTGKQLSVDLLDTAAGGSSLRSARHAVSIPTSNLDRSNSLLTPDGKTVIYAAAPARLDLPRIQAKLRFAEFSVRTGKLLRTLDPWWFDYTLGTLPYQQVRWASQTGRTLIVISPQDRAPLVTGSAIPSSPSSVC
jgi:hypothetical protein